MGDIKGDSKGELPLDQQSKTAGQSQTVPNFPDDASDALVTDGFLVPELDVQTGSDEPPHEAPPAYGELHDQMQFSQPGFEAGAAITGKETIIIYPDPVLTLSLIRYWSGQHKHQHQDQKACRPAYSRDRESDQSRLASYTSSCLHPPQPWWSTWSEATVSP